MGRPVKLRPGPYVMADESGWSVPVTLRVRCRGLSVFGKDTFWHGTRMYSLAGGEPLYALLRQRFTFTPAREAWNRRATKET